MSLTAKICSAIAATSLLRIAARPPTLGRFAPSTSPRAAGRGEAPLRGQTNPFSLRLRARALPTTKHQNRLASGNKREAKRRKAHANHVPRVADKCTQSAHLICRAAARHCRRRARLPALRPRLSQGLPSLTQLQAMLPATWNQAGVTRPILSQSSDSTSRLGRSTEGNDARSRSGADCESARKHRTRSTLQIASGMRPSMSEIH